MATKIICDFCGKDNAAYKEIIRITGLAKDSCDKCHNKIEKIKKKYIERFKCLDEEMLIEIDNIGKSEIKLNKKWWKIWKK